MNIVRISLLMVGALAVAGCFGDDDDGDTGLRPTMENIWPHGDGTVWTYELGYAEYVTREPEPLPEFPSLESLYAELLEPVDGTPEFAGRFRYDLALEGTVTTESGVTAQRVVEVLAPRGGGPAKAVAVTAEAAPRRLLRRIAEARPDLRDAIVRQLGPGKVDFDTIPRVTAPFFIGGYAFAFEDSGYYGYGDIDRNHSWVYLQEPLQPGNEFSLQLVPALANDIWLHGRIWSVRDQRIDGRRYDYVVECMYVLDFGEQLVTDEHGNLVGFIHSYMTAVTWFVPGVGPVGGRERSQGYVRTAYAPEGTGELYIHAYECRLEDYTLPPEE